MKRFAVMYQDKGVDCVTRVLRGAANLAPTNAPATNTTLYS